MFHFLSCVSLYCIPPRDALFSLVRLLFPPLLLFPSHVLPIREWAVYDLTAEYYVPMVMIPFCCLSFVVQNRFNSEYQE